MRIEDEAGGTRGGERLPLREWLARLEAWRILEALERARGNRSAAARELGIGRRTLYAKLRKFGIAERRPGRSPRRKNVPTRPEPGSNSPSSTSGPG